MSKQLVYLNLRESVLRVKYVQVSIQSRLVFVAPLKRWILKR